MQLRATETIVAIPHGNKVICYDYVAKNTVECAVETLYWLSLFKEWTTALAVAKQHPSINREKLLGQLDQLHKLGLLYNKKSAIAKSQRQYSTHWQWGPAAAILHFSTLNSEFMTEQESTERQIAKAQISQSPELFWRDKDGPWHENNETTSQITNLISLMAKRRTIRTPQKKSVEKCKLIDCLFAGLGITGFTKTETSVLPLKMTPSGGARNPYEAYIYVNEVKGLSQGFYHFSAVDGRLKQLSKGKAKDIASLLAGQVWTQEMPVIIFLVAIMERTMWKYPDSNAYRVVLIEAGHIAQNIMLAATAHGLTGCPTAALAHDKINKKIGLENITHTSIYAVTLGYPTNEIEKVIPNKQIPAWGAKCLNNKVNNFS